MSYKPIIGLEIHTELKTKTKMFCYSLNDPDEKHPNINICPICMGHPGTLPVINREAVEKVIMTGLALNGEIAEFSQFDRKNYFYPDLPKGYQISQYKYPLVTGGHLDVAVLHEDENHKVKSQKSKVKNTTQDSKLDKRIRIRRIHLEEDTGRLIHNSKTDSSLVDFNRAGVPLMELVTEPDLQSGEEVKKFGEDLRLILRYLGVSDADMEKGQLRIEVNLSLRPEGSNELGTKVEIKNINSFKFAADAVDYEIERQTRLLEKGEKIKAETRGWNEFKKETFSQRQKEEEYDYRYFPEPDLQPLKISKDFVEGLRAKLPELPAAKHKRFVSQYALAPDTAVVLAQNKALADYFEEVSSELKQHDADTPEKPQKQLERLAASFLTGEYLRILRDRSLAPREARVTAENFAELMIYIGEDKISNTVAKEVLEKMVETGEDPSDIIERLGLWQMSDMADLEDIARHIARENPKAADDYRKGKETSLQFLVGQVMKESRGKANPKTAQEILKKILSNDA